MQVLAILFFWLLYESTCLNLGNTIKLAKNENIKSLKESECQYHHKVIKKYLAILNGQRIYRLCGFMYLLYT